MLLSHRQQAQVFERLRDRVQAEYDESGAIGRRYRRQDEIGTPWAVTIDHQSLEDRTVTLRDRDSLEQVRIGQFHLAFLLDLEGGCARDKLHEVLAHAATIVAIVRAVPYPAHEEGGLFVVAGLGVSGESQREQQREDHGRGA